MAAPDTSPPLQTPRLATTTKPPIASSSPAFATPAHPIQPPPRLDHIRNRRPSTPQQGSTHPPPSPRTAPILPILLPPATLRPIAFRTLTKKHNLTLTASALQTLATFIGRHCGAAWREEGLAEMVLEEVARAWKRGDGRGLVDAGTPDGADQLDGILKIVDGSMAGGRIISGNRGGHAAEGAKIGLRRQGSLLDSVLGGFTRPSMDRNESQDSLGLSALDMDAEAGVEEEEETLREPRAWLKVIGAFEQPRMVYNPTRKHFERSKTTPSLFPPPSQRSDLFRQRYHVIHQRLLRNEAFLTPATTAGHKHTKPQQAWKITPIANLLGRNGTGHLLLGLLTVTPTGALALSDLTGSIQLNLDQAAPIDDVETWLCPGMVVLVDGIYDEEYNAAGGSLEGVGEIGGVIGGRLIGFSVGAPRCETRATSLSLSDTGGDGEPGILGGGFGWVDFLGVGSERAMGSRMRRLHQSLLGLSSLRTDNGMSAPDYPGDSSRNIIMLGQVHLDNPKTLLALRRLLTHYSASSTAPDGTLVPARPPLAFILFGSFIQHAALSSPNISASSSSTHDASTPGATNTTDTSSIAYKENFDALAALLADFPLLLRNSTFVFVPGDNDPWPSAFAAGAACPLPRRGIPDMFTSRVKRVFAAANADPPGVKGDRKTPGEAIWTSNPARLTLFGPDQELVLFRDDISSRLRRNAISLKNNGANNSSETDHRDARPRPQPQTQYEPDPDPSPNADTMDVDPSPRLPTLDPPTRHARRLTKTLLDQSHLSPFPLSLRPLHWSYASSALSLYPLPSAVALCDPEAESWCLVYQGCCVVNVGSFVGEGKGSGGRGGGMGDEADERTGRKMGDRVFAERSGGGRKGVCRWVEYDAGSRRGIAKEIGL